MVKNTYFQYAEGQNSTVLFCGAKALVLFVYYIKVLNISKTMFLYRNWSWCIMDYVTVWFRCLMSVTRIQYICQICGQWIGRIENQYYIFSKTGEKRQRHLQNGEVTESKETSFPCDRWFQD
jgi:hypothetical protein